MTTLSGAPPMRSLGPIRLLRFMSWLCAGTTLALISGFLVSWTRTNTGSVQFEPEEYRFDHALIDAQEIDVDLMVKNGTRGPVTLMGAPSFCGSDGCGEPQGFPQVVKSGEKGVIRLHFQAGHPGPFSHEIPIYTDCPTYPQVLLRLRGEVAPTPVATASSIEPSPDPAVQADEAVNGSP